MHPAFPSATMSEQPTERLASPHSFGSRSRGDSSVTNPKPYQPSTERPESYNGSMFTGTSRNSQPSEADEPEGFAILDRLDHWFGGRMNLE